MSKNFRIVFMGTPDFAVAALSKLVESEIEVAAVVTSTDKPAGRGQKLSSSAVKQFAVQHAIPCLQPEKLKDPEFIEDLKQFNADLFVVIAFRMLPEVVWSMPPKGTVNLHASLLPNYRGAAPINWAIINGETETGVTTFFIEKEIDTGKIIDSEKVAIAPDENAGELHDKLMTVGADLILKTVRNIRDQSFTATDQQQLIGKGEIKEAPKLFKDNCKINWMQSSSSIHNFIRGLSPYPGAWTELLEENHTKQFKLFSCKISNGKGNPGTWESDFKSYLKVFTGDGAVELLELQESGKKRMHIGDYLRGARLQTGSTFI